MNLTELLPVDQIRIPIAASDKAGVIAELVDVLSATDRLKDPDATLQTVLKRESEQTTGIGFGLAIPHGRTDGCDGLLVAAGKPAVPVDYESLDRRPVTFVVLLISPPDQAAAHIQMLAKVSRLMSNADFRNAIDDAKTAEELHAAIKVFEAQLPNGKNG